MATADFGEALNYPLRGDEAVRTHLIGGGIPAGVALVTAVLGLLSIVLPFVAFLNLLLVPVQLAIGVFLLGYFVRVARRTYAGADVPPTFDDWASLGKTGLYAFGVALVYQLPGILLMVVSYGLFFVLVVGASVLGRQGSGSGAAAVGVVGFLVVAVAFLLSLAYYVVAGYLTPISLCAYAAEDEFGAAFSLETLRRVGFTGDYAVYWIGFAGVYVAVVSVVSVLVAFLVGYLLLPFLPFLYFFLGMAAFRAFAGVYADVMNVEAVPAA